MPARKLPAAQTVESAALVAIHAYLRAGGVNPDTIGRIEQSPHVPGKQNVVYDFEFGEGRLGKLLAYWVVENVPRQYLWCEVAIGAIGSTPPENLMRFMLERNRGFIANYKLCLTEEGVLILVLRCAADAFTPAYLAEALQQLEPASARLRAELREYGIIPVKHADEDKKVH